MQTGLIVAGDHLIIAQTSHPAFLAFTLVATLRIGQTHSAILTGIDFFAGCNFRFTITARKTGRTLARVQIGTGIVTGAAILTGTMIRAVVQILIAEQTAPAFVAHAIEGFLAGSKLTAGIEFAFVAQRSLPAGLTTAKREDRKK